MTFFDLNLSEADGKARFQELTKQYHSDKTGDDLTSNKLYLLIREEYDEFRAIKKHWSDVVKAVMRNKTAWLGVVKDNQDLIFSAGQQIFDLIKQHKASKPKDDEV